MAENTIGAAADTKNPHFWPKTFRPAVLASEICFDLKVGVAHYLQLFKKWRESHA